MTDAATNIGFSLVAALLGAVFAYAFRLALQWARDRRIDRRFRIAGRFATRYTDTDEGELVWHYGMTTLDQRGAAITGATVEDGIRSWNLIGTLEPGGFIHGVYGAEDPHDRGQGTFFWEVTTNGGDLVGLWAGYDSVDHGLDHGVYELRRCAAETVGMATPDDVDDVTAILGAALGEAYVTRKTAELSIVRDDQLCLCARDGHGRLIGALTAIITDEGLPEQLVPVGMGEQLQRVRLLGLVSKVLLVRNVAVDPAVRGRGVATDLIETALRWGRENGARAVVSFGWTSASHGCHIEGAMRASGLQVEFDVPDFWKAESVQEGYDCPACGNPCRCSARIFARRLESTPPTLDGRAAVVKL